MKNNLIKKHGNLFSLKAVFRIKTHFKKSVFEIYLTVFYLFLSDFFLFTITIISNGTGPELERIIERKTKQKKSIHVVLF